MPTFADALPALDARFGRLHEQEHVPGVAWGVIRDGTLVHSGGIGTLRAGESLVPDADSIFRIASMTKSFTAAAILLLRDEGRLRLDDAVAAYVPQLAAWRGPTADSRPITIRELLTMSAGLPTDDPWGDRQQGLPLDQFAALLEAGPTFAWPPGVTFEYSNLGYGILGRVVSAAAGQEYREFVTARLLVPLGMTATGYREEDLPAARVAHGYVRRGEDLVREGMDPYGALASMGGLYSSVRDLATWVAGFLDAFPARDDPEGGHPLSRASRREMQQVQRAFSGFIEPHGPDEAPLGKALGYGFGLFMVSAADTGLRVGHGGGYPGFGSFMVWHPATGIGIVGLGNHRYANVNAAAVEQLGLLVRADGVTRRRLRPLSSLARFQEVAERLLDAWDDTLADDAFAMNMDLDEPREARRTAASKLAGDLGPFRRDDARPPRADSPAHLEWWLRGERGWVLASIQLSPEPEPRLQALSYTGVPDPAPAIRSAVDTLLAAAADPGAEWPPSLAVDSTLDVALVGRSLRAAAARLGPMRRGHPTAGDGTTTTTYEIEAPERRGADDVPGAPATIAVTLDPATGTVTAVTLRVTQREAPIDAW